MKKKENVTGIEFFVSLFRIIYDALRLVPGLEQIFHKNDAQWKTYLCSRTFLKIFGSHFLFFSTNLKRFVKIEVNQYNIGHLENPEKSGYYSYLRLSILKWILH